jgi:elongation factor 1-alpha
LNNNTDTTKTSKKYFVENSLSLESISLNKLNNLKSKMCLLFDESFNKKTCYCLLGISENGENIGLSPADESQTLKVIELICQELNAQFTVTEEKAGLKGKIIELLIEKIGSNSNSKPEIKVGLFGEDSCGKSTLIGVIVNGCLDDGNGSARSNIFRYQHELFSGKTSTLSHYVSSFKVL